MAKLFKIYAGSTNPIHVFGCPPERDPDCAQPENPIGYMGVHREHDAITWCEICKRIEKIYGCSCDKLAVGDKIEVMLIPSFSEVESMALRATSFVDGFAIDVGIDDGINDLAPFAGTAWRSTFPEDSCSTTELVGEATMVSEMVGPDPYLHVFRADPTAPVMVGSRAGKVVINIVSVPTEPVQQLGCGATGPSMNLRVNYRNHATCCHSDECPGPDACA